MSEGRRGWAISWWVPLVSAVLVSLLVRGLRQELLPSGWDWFQWAPLVTATACVWLAWTMKCWLLGVLTGLVILNHPHMDWSALQSLSGWQLAGLMLTACWTAHFFELLWASAPSSTTWILWTVVGGGLLALPLANHGVGAPACTFLAAVLFVLLSACGLAVLWRLHNPGQSRANCRAPGSPMRSEPSCESQKPTVQAWKVAASLLAPLALAGEVVLWAAAKDAWSAPDSLVPASSEVWSRWQESLHAALPLPKWVGGVWTVMGLVLWSWWRSLRRAQRCASHNQPPSSVVLPLTFLAAAISLVLFPDKATLHKPIVLVPMTVVCVGYLGFDWVHGVLERMQLPPPNPQEQRPAG